MRPHPLLVLDVRELLEHPGSRRPLAFDSPVPGLDAGLAHVQGDVHFDLVLEAIEGGVLVSGEFSGELSVECRRCLKPTTKPFSFQASEIYRPASDAWEESYVIKDSSIDLEPMTRDTIALNLPTNPLCREDCQGLCSQCGADLNEGPCNHEEEIDLRWSALRELGRDLPDRNG